jgi:hypothetical protein
MWKITKNIIDFEGRTHSIEHDHHDTLKVKSYDYKEGIDLPHKFLMLDDDKELYFEGLSNDDSSFDPLDDFGMPNYGCTDIKYFDTKTNSYQSL